jgi:hypothetical protein
MKQKTTNFGTTTQLKHLAAFLNGDLKIFGSGNVLGDTYAAAKGVQGPTETLRNQLREMLGTLVAPEATVPVTARRSVRKKFRTSVVNRYLTPENLINRLVKRLNDQRLTPRWRIEKASKTSPAIELRGFRASVIMNGFGWDMSSRVWATIAKLLESGEIVMLGQCAICNMFYVKTREWQKCCSKTECKRKYDNMLSAERKARARASKRKAKPK